MRIRRTHLTLLYGKQLNLENLAGTLLGVKDDLDGILNAVQCVIMLLGQSQHLICILEDLILNFLIMIMRSPNQRLIISVISGLTILFIMEPCS